jgi:hypothetical protein
MSHSNNAKNLLSKYIEYLKENPVKHCICALDYSSLYPSLIMTYNLSPEYLILDKEYKEEVKDKGKNIHDINFEYKYENYLGEKNVKYIEAWTVRHDESKEISEFGLYPTILKDLFAQRAQMKKELFIYKEKKEHIESEQTDYLDDPVYKECLFMLKYCDTKQKALKVFMNTFYGELGNKNSPLFVLELAGAVTSAGQANLLLVKDYVEKLNHKVYYGDSVTGDTPILIRINKKYLKLVAIEEYLKDYRYDMYNGNKEIINIDNLDIESQEIYTEKGWTPIKKLIRHYTNKRLFRITTDMGSIIVTKDHSLLNENKEKIRPGDCKIGTKLLHWKDLDLTYYNTNNTNISYKYIFNNNILYYSKSQLDVQNKYLELKKNKKNIKINIIDDIYILEEISNKYKINNSIKYIEEIPNNGKYVYDLETESHHFAAGVGKMVVHNTDSLYISCPESYYLEKNKEYYTEQISKLQYNTDLVTITFKAIEDIKIKVNNYLYQNNGTKYLKMAYEEILWPCAFLSKKKYFGIPHENIPNFKPADMFIRGLEVKKRGVSEILRIICLDIMWESLDLKNTKTLRELIIQKIKEIFVKKWELKDFIQTGLWKPEKKNVTLNEFAERMKEENKIIPEPGERFNYVIIKKYPYKYDFKGRQIPLKKADKMEYLETVVENNYEIDLKYYFDNQLSGQFARLLSYDNEFTEYSIDDESGQFEYDDNKTLNKCKKYILQLVEMHGNNYIDRNKVFKNIYKEISKKYKDIKYTKLDRNTYNKKYDILFSTLNNSSDDSDNLYKLINDNIEKYVNKTYNFSILSNNIIKKYKNNEKTLIQLYNGKHSSFYNLQQNALNTRYNSKLDTFLKNIIEKKLSNIIFNIDNMNIINIIQHIRQKYNIDKICGSQEEIDTIYDIIDENELDINLLDIDLYTKIDPDLIKKIYNDYIHLIALKKLNILNTYIYNNVHIVKSSKDKDIKKPYGFKF